MSYEELLDEYGLEYLREHNHGDYALYDMGEFNEIVNLDGMQAEDVFDMGRMAYSYITGDPNNKKNEWMWSDDYFFFDGYGHLCSISDGQLQDYFSYHIEESDFMEWCEDMGYTEGEIEE